MKTTISAKESKREIKYPSLMKDNHGMIVLFTQEDSGVVLDDPSGEYDKGHYSEFWQTSWFKPFAGSITLEND